ncbi:MAG: hypothetical protein M1834_001994 [Cirrosporium novae-zelandiae]|nr:MAG: hypothetical protein M1834_001994 [Cirrosporium novae-zelandiae]
MQSNYISITNPKRNANSALTYTASARVRRLVSHFEKLNPGGILPTPASPSSPTSPRATITTTANMRPQQLHHHHQQQTPQSRRLPALPFLRTTFRTPFAKRLSSDSSITSTFSNSSTTSLSPTQDVASTATTSPSTTVSPSTPLSRSCRRAAGVSQNYSHPSPQSYNHPSLHHIIYSCSTATVQRKQGGNSHRFSGFNFGFDSEHDSDSDDSYDRCYYVKENIFGRTEMDSVLEPRPRDVGFEGIFQVLEGEC